MFGLSFAHMILLAAIALIVIGPKQLPEVARTLGRFLNELKRVTGDVAKTITDARDFTNDAIYKQNTEDTPPTSAATGHGPEAGPDAGSQTDPPAASHNQIKSDESEAAKDKK